LFPREPSAVEFSPTRCMCRNLPRQCPPCRCTTTPPSLPGAPYPNPLAVSFGTGPLYPSSLPLFYPSPLLTAHRCGFEGRSYGPHEGGGALVWILPRVIVLHFLFKMPSFKGRAVCRAVVSRNPGCDAYLELCAVWTLCGYSVYCPTHPLCPLRSGTQSLRINVNNFAGDVITPRDPPGIGGR